MPPTPPKPPLQPQRKLTRDQVKEILERNATLFKDDENFVSYLIDLALYLLEYEYDWKESGSEPPRQISNDMAAGSAKGIPLSTSPGAAKGTLSTFRHLGGGAVTPVYGKTCPHCGGKVPAGEVICPQCRNMVR